MGASLHRPGNKSFQGALSVEAPYLEAELSCAALLKAMLYTGQHRWGLLEAMQIAANLGFDRWKVQSGRRI
jgi:protein-disulfide isomerase-like protein with CxxC motif